MKANVNFVVLGLMFASSMILNAQTQLEPVYVEEIVQVENSDTSASGLKSIIYATVWSGGCTNEKSFEVDVVQSRLGQELSIIRTQKFMCEAVAQQIQVELETDLLTDMRKNPVIIKNPVLETQE